MASAKLAPPPVPRRFWPRPDCPALVTDANRIIGEERIYDLVEVRRLVMQHGVVVLNDDTNAAQVGAGRNPLPAPAWSNEEFVAVIMALVESDHENAQWCKLNVNTYLDCDSYTINYSRKLKTRSTNPNQGIKLYVKFGFFLNGSRAVVCRLHPAY